MIRDRIGVTSITVVVIMFLTVMGVRQPFLDKSGKPKPGTGAVLNHFAKLISDPVLSTKPSFPTSIDVSNIPVAPRVPLSCEICGYLVLQVSPAASAGVSLSKGRSPPCS